MVVVVLSEVVVVETSRSGSLRYGSGINRGGSGRSSSFEAMK